MTESLHNHTTWSDGVSDVRTMVAAAEAAGVLVLGITDHLVVDPSGILHPWSMDPGQVGAYVQDVRAAAHDVPGVTVRCGVEADFIPETAEETQAIIRAAGIDFIVASVHFVDGFPVDSRAEDWEALTADERDEVHRRYWRLIEQMAIARFGDIAAHLDLTKKFGFRPRIDLTNEINRALDAIAAAGMKVEINTAGWHKPCNEAYPALDILCQCRERRIPIIINADAHDPAHLTRDFDRARDFLAAVMSCGSG